MSKANPPSSIRLKKKWWSEPLGHVLWFLILLACSTLRKRVVNLNGADDVCGSYQCIAAIWHNRVFVPCHIYRYCIKGKTPISMLTSASKDGTMLATIAKHYGMRAVRGSSSRRGVAGFLDMVKEIKDGCCMVITPDGPKGPRYKCRGGIVRLASMTGLPIIPVNIQYESYWRVNRAWDGFVIPKPFSKVTLVWGKRILVPADITDEQQAEYCRLIEEKMAHGTPDFPAVKAD